MRRGDAPLALEDLVTATHVIARCASGDGAGLTRAAWVIRNRARRAWRARAVGEASPFGDGSIAAAASSLAAEIKEMRAPSSRRTLRAAGALCLVLSGDRADVSGGATSAAALRTN